MERLHAVIHGRVQGVGFRYFLLRRATELGLQGWVRNNDDGTVEIVAEGPRAGLEHLRRAAEQGPPAAGVQRVEAEWMPATGGLESFEPGP
ncbi:MAG TPA: acylphosphatase [Patescibacteria group bacterium]|nr:acylphosphatase [Patescibacteria group bacterium]